ncbi:MAG TPA: hypothetical protein K8W19_15685 [Victivallis vadensis]|nr:hypothetical protein [Victivallis vadensis]
MSHESGAAASSGGNPAPGADGGRIRPDGRKLGEEVKAQMREIAEYNGTFFRSGSGEGFGLEKHLKAAGFDGVRVLNRLASVGLTNYVEVVVFDAKDIEITEIEDEESED